MKIIDAKGLVAGRLASKVAKELLMGETVSVVNVSDVVVSGTLAYEIKRLNSLKHQKSKTNPEHSPKYPRVPRMLFKRMVRGMLPKKTSRGRDALHRLRAYEGVPVTIDMGKAERPAGLDKKPVKATTLGAVCRAFSWAPQQ
ncbi:50S ribosomal protein L13 [uncultured archaeon]|nr:50S ribosomal protein L13 [uncultured archaeon]